MEASPQFKRINYVLCILIGFLVLAAAFFIVNKTVLYFSFRSEAQENVDRLITKIEENEELILPRNVMIQPQQEVSGIGLRGTQDQTMSWHERLLNNDHVMDATTAPLLADELSSVFPVHWLLGVSNQGEVLSVFPAQMPQKSAIELLKDDALKQAWHAAQDTGLISFAGNFEVFTFGTPEFTAIVPYSHNDDVLYSFVLKAEPTVTHRTVVRAVAAATACGFLIVLIFAVSAVAFLWRSLKERWQTTKTIRFLAHNDPLTHLPNRAVFNEELTKALRKSNVTLAEVYVIAVDVDKFKEINDTHGHAAGDLFLQVIADRLRLVFDDHLVARISGDEFAVLLEEVPSQKQVEVLTERLVSAVKAPCHVDGKNLEISLSMGIAKSSDAAWRSSRLLHCADLALYRTKTGGRNGYTWYHPSMDEELQYRKALEAEMRKALACDNFSVQYQAQVSLSDKKLKGFEALLRWQHEDRGWISPDVFIPLAEETGLIEELGEYILRKACKDAASWVDSSLKVAVNFSPSQFRTGEIENKIESALRDAGLPPRRLEIEITESLLMKDTSNVVASLKRISDMGVSIAMDDFGTGYSSLSYLSKFPFNKIKIDRSFITNLGQDAHTDAIVASIIGLGRSLDVLITAEGVENDTQRKILRAAGCDLVQGFLFGKPRVIDPENPYAAVKCLQNVSEGRMDNAFSSHEHPVSS
ncbi:bifunctional diguanylate cyclase/phosphodiesterase [Pseudovibrio exalbescens]|uniref:putative bifunctional diguanylate cyclase/phosphodiesterase n=1 Tax=Pseudovibrio exalbescens TaxID=197461 RepID=UPI0023669A20|nr:bifunctional diguanylate cyclase/phosphodiesterase [Pseudovibrio exalbescens]MDD7910305.1 bifunctional diguanylate cyclase/phosphodiesterase [Pseudovibrio exalbescens]